jgi:transcription initiation factor IIE alpha subunit
MTENENGKIEFRAVVKLTQFLCPRCGVMQEFDDKTFRPQAILNATAKGILASLVCPECNHIVQVWTAGETYHELKKDVTND